MKNLSFCNLVGASRFGALIGVSSVDLKSLELNQMYANIFLGFYMRDFLHKICFITIQVLHRSNLIQSKQNFALDCDCYAYSLLQSH